MPILSQNKSLPLPKRSKLFLEQSMREREDPTCKLVEISIRKNSSKYNFSNAQKFPTRSNKATIDSSKRNGSKSQLSSWQRKWAEADQALSSSEFFELIRDMLSIDYAIRKNYVLKCTVWWRNYWITQLILRSRLISKHTMIMAFIPIITNFFGYSKNINCFSSMCYSSIITSIWWMSFSFIFRY